MPEKKDGKILVMDDEEMIRNVVRKMLVHAGYEVVLASNGEEAIRVYREARQQGEVIDALIMDLTISGGMGGREAVRKILEIDPEAKAVVSSGLGNDPVLLDFQNHGFCAAVKKPFQMKELIGTIDRILSR